MSPISLRFHCCYLFVALAVAVGQPGSAQSTAPRGLAIGTNLHAGYLLPQYPFLHPLIDDYVRSGEVTVTRQTTGASFWDQLYHYPEYGVSLFYSTLGNDEHLGRELALTSFVRYYWRSEGRLRPYTRLGIGGTYATRKFDAYDNYQNVAIASHLNVHVNLRFGAKLTLSETLSTQAGLSFDHLSNANTSEPNRGLNYVTAFAGVQYQLVPPASRTVRAALPELPGKNSLALVAYLGRKSPSSAQSEYYLASALGVEYVRRVNWGFAVGAGVDLTHNSATRPTLAARRETFRDGDSFGAGVNVSQALVYRRSRLMVQSGVLLTGEERIMRSVLYNRAIFEYAVADQYLFRLVMRSKLHVLNYAELGIGYKLRL